MSTKVAEKKEVIFNPLSNKKILVKYIMKHKAGISDKQHPIYGGKLDVATDKFYVKINPRTGVPVDPFNANERAFVAEKLGIQEERLSPHYMGKDNYWNTYSVSLDKMGDILNMMEVTDFIKYKVLLTNDGLIAPNPKVINNKPSYRYFIVDEQEEVELNTKSLDDKKHAFLTYAKIEDDKFKLAYCVWRLTNKSVPANTQMKDLKAQLNNQLESKLDLFNKVTSDKYFDYKVIINKALMYSVVSRKNEEYFLEGVPIAEEGVSATLDNAAIFIGDPINQEKLFLIEERIKNAME